MKDLKKLTKYELIHICENLVKDGEIEKNLKKALKIRGAGGTRCWDCKEIASKLGVS